MIVKNAANDLADILATMQTIANEIIIVDTGSTDATTTIAADYGARVIKHVWNDSFAEARNVYVTAASCDFIFSIDADERIAAEDLPIIKQAIQAGPQGFLMTTRNYNVPETSQGFTICRGQYPDYEKGHRGYSPSTKVRIFPRLDGIVYEGFVRELIEPSLERAELNIGEILVPIHHFGVATPEKQAYYRELLYKKCSQNPDNPRNWMELATEDFHLNNFTRAADEMRRSIELFTSGHNAAYYDLGAACNTYAVTLIKLGHIPEALTAFELGLRAGGPSSACLKSNREMLLQLLKKGSDKKA